jgi:hypothetical protein
MHSLQKVTVLLAAMLLGMPVSAKSICSQKFCAAGSSSLGCFRRVEGDLRTFMRSNPAGSLACFREQVETSRFKTAELVKELSQFSGVIGGDVKPDNVDIVLLAGGKCDIGLIDLDDGGQGSLFGDFFHTLTYNSVWLEEENKKNKDWPWKEQISFKKAIEAYGRGLRNQDLPGVLSLAEILDPKSGGCPSPTSVTKPKSCEKLRKEKADEWRKDLTELEKAAEARFAADKEILAYAVRKRGNEVIETRIRVKKHGGSMCLPRFLFLVAKPDGITCEVIEFKQQGKPAADIFGGRPDSHKARIDSLIKHYRSGDQGSTIDVVRANSNDYWQRTDEEPLFDGGEKQETNAEAERHKAFTQHMMYWLGSVHRKQSQEYAERLERLLPEISDDLKNMVKEHVAALKAKQKKAPKGTGNACTLSNRHSPGA